MIWLSPGLTPPNELSKVPLRCSSAGSTDGSLWPCPPLMSLQYCISAQNLITGSEYSGNVWVIWGDWWSHWYFMKQYRSGSDWWMHVLNSTWGYKVNLCVCEMKGDKSLQNNNTYLQSCFKSRHMYTQVTPDVSTELEMPWYNLKCRNVYVWVSGLWSGVVSCTSISFIVQQL